MRDDALMTDQTDRELESRQTDETKYDRELEDEERRRHEAAEHVKDDLPAEGDESQD